MVLINMCANVGVGVRLQAKFDHRDCLNSPEQRRLAPSNLFGESRSQMRAVIFRTSPANLCGGRAVVLASILGLLMATLGSLTSAIGQTTTPGCWSNGTWYPEGSVLVQDPRRRIVMPGNFVCRNGKWVLETRGR